MPIYLAPTDQTMTIKMIKGTDKIKKHLENLGFIAGAEIMVINHVANNIIVKIKGVSLAIDKDLAKRILV